MRAACGPCPAPKLHFGAQLLARLETPGSSVSPQATADSRQCLGKESGPADFPDLPRAKWVSPGEGGGHLGQDPDIVFPRLHRLHPPVCLGDGDELPRQRHTGYGRVRQAPGMRMRTPCPGCSSVQHSLQAPHSSLQTPVARARAQQLPWRGLWRWTCLRALGMGLCLA